MKYYALATALATLQADVTVGYMLNGAPTTHQHRAHVAMRVETRTGSSFLPADTVERAKGGNPIEKAKLAKDGTSAFTDIYEFAAAIRAGTLTWEEIEKEDLNTRLKWVGMLHRAKRTPGRFMMRLRTPNGLVSSDLWRFYADCVEPYGPEVGVVDITTRANIQVC